MNDYIKVKKDCSGCPFNVNNEHEWCCYYDNHCNMDECRVVAVEVILDDE